MSRLRFDESIAQKAANMSGEEYYNFLKDYIFNEMKNMQGEAGKKNYKSGLFYKFLIYAPASKEGNIIENKERKKFRLKLKKELLDEYTKKLENDGKIVRLIEDEDILYSEEVQEKLNINKKNLTGFGAIGELLVMNYGKKIVVNKNSILSFLNERHFIGADIISFELMQKINNLMSEKNDEKFRELLNSEEYKDAVKLYLKTVPEELRVFSDFPIIKSLDDKKNPIFKENPKELYELYNLYLKKVPEKHYDVPKLYPVGVFKNQLSDFIGLKGRKVSERTLIRYCEKGIIPYYRIGSKYLMSVEDVNNSQERIEKFKSSYMRSPNSGKKTNIEKSLLEINYGYLLKGSSKVPNEILTEYNKYLKLIAKKGKEYNSLIKDKKVQEALNKDPAYVLDFFTPEEKEIRRSTKACHAELKKYENEFKKIRNEITEIIIESYPIDEILPLTNEMTSVLKNINKNKKRILKNEKSGQTSIVKLIEKENDVLYAQIDVIKNKILEFLLKE